MIDMKRRSGSKTGRRFKRLTSDPLPPTKYMEEIAMLLTKKGLSTILENLRARVPAEMEKELLDEYGNQVTDDEGHVFEYTEQDICEQLRKKLSPYAKNL